MASSASLSISSDALGIALGQQDQRVLIAGKPRQRILRLEQSSQAPSQRQQDRIPDRDSQGIVDLLEAIEIDHDYGRFYRGIGLGEGEHPVEAIEEQLAIGQAGEIVMDRVVEQPLRRILE